MGFSFRCVFWLRWWNCEVWGEGVGYRCGEGWSEGEKSMFDFFLFGK